MVDLAELFQFLPDMVETISKSEEQTREMGFMICREEDGSLHREAVCVGEECDVEIRDCEDGVNHADFHIHLSEVVDAQIVENPLRVLLAAGRGWTPAMTMKGLTPSAGDLFCSWLRDVRASCIGNAMGICCHEVIQYENLKESDKIFADEISQNRADWVVGKLEENPVKIAKALSWYRTLTELMETPHNDKFFGDTLCRFDGMDMDD